MCNKVKDMTTQDFHKGDRVEYTDPRTGKVHTGTVSRIMYHETGERLSVDIDDGGRIRWGAKNFRPSNTKAPAKAHQHNPFTKGDRVMATGNKGKGRCGTVVSVRDERISVDLDDGMTRLRGHFSLYQKI